MSSNSDADDILNEILEDSKKSEPEPQSAPEPEPQSAPEPEQQTTTQK